jgi:hypothetical protein
VAEALNDPPGRAEYFPIVAAKANEYIQNGRVHSGLTLRQARALVAEFQGCPLRRQSGRTGLRSRLLRLSRFVRQTLGEWSAADRFYATAQLKNLLEQIASNSNGSVSETACRVQSIFDTVSPLELNS